MSILELPTEILCTISSTLQGDEFLSFARVHRTLYPKLRLALIKYDIRYQRSSALHWAAKIDNRAFAKTLLSYRANMNAIVDNYTPLMIAAKYDSRLVLDLLRVHASGQDAGDVTGVGKAQSSLNVCLHPRYSRSTAPGSSPWRWRALTTRP